MPKRLIALCLAAALTCGSGAVALAAPPGVVQVPPVSTVAVQDGLRLEARPLESAYAAGQIALIEATATNTGSETLEYWLSTPCDTPFRVTVTSPSGGPVTLPRESDLGKGPTMCIQVIKLLRLAPGASVSERFAWDTAAAKVAPGGYTVSVAFSAHSESGAPNTAVTFPLRIGAGAAGLSDISNHWAAESVRQAVRAGFVDGYPDGLFKPNSHVTRAEFIKMLVVARGLATRTSAAPAFTDVQDHWVETQGYLEAAVEAGFLHPEDYGRVLKPDEPLTRAETAMLVVRAMAQERRALMLTPDQLPFADKDAVNKRDAGFVMTAGAEGIIKGYEDQTFRPDRPVTRAEAVTMLLRMLGAVAVKVAPDAGLQVDGQAIPATVAVVEKYGQFLAPLPELAEATAMQVTDDQDGWLMLSRAGRTVHVKMGVPYLIDGAGKHQPLDVAPPVRFDGKVYLPEAVFNYLGISGHWDAGANAFVLTTGAL